MDEQEKRVAELFARTREIRSQRDYPDVQSRYQLGASTDTNKYYNNPALRDKIIAHRRNQANDDRAQEYGFDPEVFKFSLDTPEKLDAARHAHQTLIHLEKWNLDSPELHDSMHELAFENLLGVGVIPHDSNGDSYFGTARPTDMALSGQLGDPKRDLVITYDPKFDRKTPATVPFKDGPMESKSIVIPYWAMYNEPPPKTPKPRKPRAKKGT